MFPSCVRRKLSRIYDSRYRHLSAILIERTAADKISPVNTQSSTHNTLLIAVPTIILSIFLFDVQGVFIKHMGKQYPVEQITLFRNFFGLFPHILVWFFSTVPAGTKRSWKLVRWKLGFGRGLMLIGAQMCFYYAILNMQLATATTLAFSGPLFLTLLSIPLLGHTVGLWRWSAVLVGFVGVVMVMQPGADAFRSVALLPIGAAFFYASASLTSRYFDSDVSTALINIYSTLSALIAALLITVVSGHWIPMHNATDWLWFIAMGSVGGVAVLLLITAYRMAEPSLLSPFEYFGIPFSFFLGWYFFAEAPFDSLFPGVLLIVGGGLLVIWRERVQRNKVKREL